MPAAGFVRQGAGAVRRWPSRAYATSRAAVVGGFPAGGLLGATPSARLSLRRSACVPPRSSPRRVWRRRPVYAIQAPCGRRSSAASPPAACGATGPRRVPHPHCAARATAEVRQGGLFLVLENSSEVSNILRIGGADEFAHSRNAPNPRPCEQIAPQAFCAQSSRYRVGQNWPGRRISPPLFDSPVLALLCLPF